MRRVRLAALLVFASASLPAAADSEVLLSTGKVLIVEAVRADHDEVWMDLPGGGTIAVPEEQVVEIRRDADAPEPVAVEPAAPVAAERSTEDPTSTDPLPEDLDRIIEDAARRHGVDPRLVRAVIVAESRGDAKAVSPKGAMGLMQLMPATARARGVSDPFNAAQNIDAGTAELADWLEDYAGEVALAVAAYNAGGRAVDRHDGIPPYRETLRYVRQVLDLYFDSPSE